MKRILVVEDSHAEQQVAYGLLTQAGFEVNISASAELAWEWLQTHPLPDLILLDIVMPGKSGLELCRMIRAESSFEGVPIIFCSSKKEQFDRFWALRQGGTAYITKPYAPKGLLQIVSQYIQ